MDIRSRTNDETSLLDLLDLRYEPDGPAFVGRFVIESNGYGAELPLWLHVSTVRTLVDKLRAMDTLLRGHTELWPAGDFHRVRLRLTQRGALEVTAELGVPTSNHLMARFTTDQTCLAPLIDDLERLMRTVESGSSRYRGRGRRALDIVSLVVIPTRRLGSARRWHAPRRASGCPSNNQ